MFSARLEAMAPLQHRFLGQPDFARQLGTGLPLQHPPDDQDHMLRDQLAAREDRATIEVIDALAAVTARDGQPTAGVDAKQACFPRWCVAVRAPQPGGMKMVLQPGNTLVIIEEVNDRKIHTRDCTNSALLV